jgi:lysophospholipase L1-like esterase
MITTRLKAIVPVLLFNIALTVALFGLLELGYRIYTDGLTDAIDKIVSGVPYSNLGTSNWVIYDEELGYRLNPERPNINALSVRHAEIAIPKPPGLHRTIVLGDSIPWDGKGFVTQLQEAMKSQGNHEVINAAVPGYTGYQELTFYKRFLLPADADLLIWTYCLNDNFRFLHNFDSKGRMLVTDEAWQSLRIRSTWDFIVSRSYVLSSFKVWLVGANQRRADRNSSAYPWESKVDFNIAWKDYSWGAHEHYLREMTRLVRSRQTRLAIVIFPYEPQLTSRHDARRDYVTKPQRLLNALCHEYGVPCLDLFPPFSAAYDRGEKLYRDGIHLSDEGHRLTTSLLQAFLLENGLLPAR